MKKFILAGLGFVTLFFVAGYYFASDEVRVMAEIIWLITLVLTSLCVIAFCIGLVGWMWARANNAALVFPDENGNYPMRIGRRSPANPNLTGSDNPAWALWMATNNRSGSQAREAFNITPPPSAQPPIFSSSQDVPPILLEAKTIAEEL